MKELLSILVAGSAGIVLAQDDSGTDANLADAGITHLLNPRAQTNFRVRTEFDQKRGGWFLGFCFGYRF